MKNKRFLFVSIAMLILFALWTVLVKVIDVKEIGPKSSAVGFASINDHIHNLTGVNMTLYNITDWLSLVPIAIVLGFGCLGVIQLIKRKNLFKVDYDILALGVFYVVVMIVFIFFEIFVINYRPTLIEGVLEASYPSSTTMLVMCVMPTSIMQFHNRIKNKTIRNIINVLCASFMIFMVVGRVISGVHWVSDIIGGILLSSGLVIMYYYISNNQKALV